MTVIQAYAVFAVVIPAAALIGVLAGRITYLRLSARHVCGSHVAAPLPAAVNRQAANSAVLSKGWAETDHQTWITQSVPVDQVGLHRLGERASRG